MKKKFVYLWIALIIIFLFSACGNNRTPQERIERICGIELPEGMEVIFHYTYDSVSGPDGLYTIFKLKEEPTHFLSKFTLKEKMGPTSEKDFDYSLAGHVDKEYYPKWENNYYRVTGITNIPTIEISSIEVLYFPDILELIFLILPSD